MYILRIYYICCTHSIHILQIHLYDIQDILYTYILYRSIIHIKDNTYVICILHIEYIVYIL